MWKILNISLFAKNVAISRKIEKPNLYILNPPKVAIVDVVFLVKLYLGAHFFLNWKKFKIAKNAISRKN